MGIEIVRGRDRFEERRLVVECDYHAFPVWGPDSACDPDEVEFTDELRAELQAWADEWTDVNWPGEEDDKRHESPEWRSWYDEWWVRGTRLIERIRSEVGPEWEVVYGHGRPERAG